MRLSAKSRYALASMVVMAQDYSSGECITVISISERLGISKIYLEQVFSLLKRGGLVNSVKGAQGGYILTRAPRNITAYDVLSAIEQSLFEATEDTVTDRRPDIDSTMQELVFNKLDSAIKSTLSSITLQGLVYEAAHRSEQGLMYFI
ncbi:MAG: RrF2 family transcriptional regulator [Christensenellales bacterium]|jgi:Rrf2 family protein